MRSKSRNWPKRITDTYTEERHLKNDISCELIPGLSKHIRKYFYSFQLSEKRWLCYKEGRFNSTHRGALTVHIVRGDHLPSHIKLIVSHTYYDASKISVDINFYMV